MQPPFTLPANMLELFGCCPFGMCYTSKTLYGSGMPNHVFDRNASVSEQGRPLTRCWGSRLTTATSRMITVSSICEGESAQAGQKCVSLLFQFQHATSLRHRLVALAPRHNPQSFAKPTITFQPTDTTQIAFTTTTTITTTSSAIIQACKDQLFW